MWTPETVTCGVTWGSADATGQKCRVSCVGGTSDLCESSQGAEVPVGFCGDLQDSLARSDWKLLHLRGMFWSAADPLVGRGRGKDGLKVLKQ